MAALVPVLIVAGKGRVLENEALDNMDERALTFVRECYEFGYTVRLGSKMTQAEDKTKEATRALVAAATPLGEKPQEASKETPPSLIKRSAKIIGDSWQLISAVIGIVTVIAAGFTYFATQKQLDQLDCRMSQNLILTTYPSQVEQLKLQIDLALQEQVNLNKQQPGSLEVARKQKEIEEFTTTENQKNEAYQQTLEQIKRGECSASNRLGKKP